MNLDEIVANCKASQNKIELRKVLQYVGEIDPKVIVEIGAWRGWQLETFDQAYELDFLIGIEIDEANIDQEVKQRLPIIVGDSHKQETLQELITKLNGKKIDFLYIDGDHTYEGVKRDFEMYGPLVREGGIVGFDDIMLNGPKWTTAGVEVNRFWLELIAKAGTKSYVFWDEQGQGTGDGLWFKPYGKR